MTIEVAEIQKPSSPPLNPSHIDSQPIVISVEHVGKMYRIYDQPQDRLKQMLSQGRRQFGHQFWALRDVSFEVRKGETIGIIGRNGSGKSTILQIIAGTLAPTEGRVQVSGRVAALLELGSGFNPEFTGEENIYLNGAIFGIHQHEMEARFADIAAFADIGDFIYQPVKLYSSGMYARLAFAIGIHLKPDIFIIDEALSVGDVFFQSRCVRKLDEYRNSGGTVLFVTHDTYAVERICTRSIVLNRGSKVFEGSNVDAVNTYYQLERGGQPVSSNDTQMVVGPDAGSASIELRRDYVTGDGSAYIDDISITDALGRPTSTFQVGEWMTVHIKARFHRDLELFDFGVGIRDRAGVLLGGAHTFYEGDARGPVGAGEQRLLTARIQLNIIPDTYLLLVGLARTFSLADWEEYYALWDCVAINVMGKPAFWGMTQLPHELS